MLISLFVVHMSSIATSTITGTERERESISLLISEEVEKPLSLEIYNQCLTVANMELLAQNSSDNTPSTIMPSLTGTKHRSRFPIVSPLCLILHDSFLSHSDYVLLDSFVSAPNPFLVLNPRDGKC